MLPDNRNLVIHLPYDDAGKPKILDPGFSPAPVTALVPVCAALDGVLLGSDT